MRGSLALRTKARELSGRMARSSGFFDDGNGGAELEGRGVMDGEGVVGAVGDEEGFAVGGDAGEDWSLPVFAVATMEWVRVSMAVMVLLPEVVT